jgi:hypothetical protein
MKPPVATSLTSLAQVDAFVADTVDVSESLPRCRLCRLPAHPGMLEFLDAHREVERELIIYIATWIGAEETAIPTAETVAGHDGSSVLSSGGLTRRSDHLGDRRCVMRPTFDFGAQELPA